MTRPPRAPGHGDAVLVAGPGPPDAPALCAELRALVARQGATRVVCDARGVRAELASVAALAHLAAAAHRSGCRVVVRDAAPRLAEVIALCGLGAVLPCEPGRITRAARAP
jgi:anti-anti-sigma regulatory factor